MKTRSAKIAGDVDFEIELQRVKRDNDVELSRVKRMDDELSRVKRGNEVELSRVKRKEEAELSRVKREPESGLSRVKRLGSFKNEHLLSRKKREQEVVLSRMKRDLMEDAELSRQKRKDVNDNHIIMTRIKRDTDQGITNGNRLDGKVRRFRRSELEQELEASAKSDVIVKKDKPHVKLDNKKRIPQNTKPGNDNTATRLVKEQTNAKVTKRKMGWWEKRARRRFFLKERKRQNKKAAPQRKRNNTKTRRFHKPSRALELTQSDKEVENVKSSAVDSVAMKKRQSYKNQKKLTE